MYPRDRKLSAGSILSFFATFGCHTYRFCQFFCTTRIREGNTFIDLTQHLWSFTFHRVILVTQSFVRFAERRIASMTKMEFERMASEAQLKADEEAEAALESVDQIEGVLRRPSQIGNQGNARTTRDAIHTDLWAFETDLSVKLAKYVAHNQLFSLSFIRSH